MRPRSQGLSSPHTLRGEEMKDPGKEVAPGCRKKLNDTDASKPVARHILPNHSNHNMTICGLSLQHGNTESRKNLAQKFIFQLGTLPPHGIDERLLSFCCSNLFTNSCDHISTNGKVPLHSHIKLQHPAIPLFALTKA